MEIKTVKYVISSPTVQLCPKTTMPEYAFIGRSNVGKSSLINDTLYPILSNYFFHSNKQPLAYDSIEGLENIDKVIESYLIDKFNIIEDWKEYKRKIGLRQ